MTALRNRYETKRHLLRLALHLLGPLYLLGNRHHWGWLMKHTCWPLLGLVRLDEEAARSTTFPKGAVGEFVLHYMAKRHRRVQRFAYRIVASRWYRPLEWFFDLIVLWLHLDKRLACWLKDWFEGREL